MLLLLVSRGGLPGIEPDYTIGQRRSVKLTTGSDVKLSSCQVNMILQEVYIWCQLPDVAFDMVDGHLGHEHLH